MSTNQKKGQKSSSTATPGSVKPKNTSKSTTLKDSKSGQVAFNSISGNLKHLDLAQMIQLMTTVTSEISRLSALTVQQPQAKASEKKKDVTKSAKADKATPTSTKKTATAVATQKQTKSASKVNSCKSGKDSAEADDEGGKWREVPVKEKKKKEKSQPSPLVKEDKSSKTKQKSSADPPPPAQKRKANEKVHRSALATLLHRKMLENEKVDKLVTLTGDSPSNIRKDKKAVNNSSMSDADSDASAPEDDDMLSTTTTTTTATAKLDPNKKATLRRKRAHKAQDDVSPALKENFLQTTECQDFIARYSPENLREAYLTLGFKPSDYDEMTKLIKQRKAKPELFKRRPKPDQVNLVTLGAGPVTMTDDAKVNKASKVTFTEVIQLEESYDREDNYWKYSIMRKNFIQSALQVVKIPREELTIDIVEEIIRSTFSVWNDTKDESATQKNLAIAEILSELLVCGQNRKSNISAQKPQ